MTKRSKRIAQVTLFIILMAFPLFQHAVMTFVWNPIFRLLGV